MEQLLETLKLVDIKYLLIFTLALIVVDIATGVWIAIFVEKNFNSKKLTEGSAKKVLILALLFITLGLDFLCKSVEVYPFITRGYCLILTAANIKSIIENAGKYVITPEIKNIKNKKGE